MEIKYGMNDIFSEDFSAIKNLLEQLKTDEVSLKMEDISKTIQGGIIFTARKEGVIVGMITLTKVHKLMGFFGTIEDVIVDEKHRRLGISTKLWEMVFAKARQLEMKYVEWTSHPKRVAANIFYEKMGAKKRDTNFYEMAF